MWVALVVLGVVSTVHLGAQLLGAGTLAALTQMMLMPALAGALWTGTASPRGRLVVLALGALGLSWVGDTVPRLLPEDISFVAMLGAFLLAQLLYAVAFWPMRRRSVLARPLRLIPYAAVAVLTCVLCAPQAGLLLPAIIVYATAIMMMAVLATGLGVRAGLGGAIFVVSDSLIALDAFGVLTLPVQGFWVMSTYLLAQLLLVLSVRRTAMNPRQEWSSGRRGPGQT